MKKIIVQLCWILLISNITTNYTYGQNYSNNELVIAFESATTTSEINAFIDDLNATEIDAILDFNLKIYLISFDLNNLPFGLSNIEEVHEFLQCNGNNNGGQNLRTRPKSVEFDYVVSANPLSINPRGDGSGSYNPHPNCGDNILDFSCKINENSKIKIAIVDAGYLKGTPFDPFIIDNGAYDFVDQDFRPNDVTVNKHGAAVTSIIGTTIMDQTRKISIVPIKILDKRGEASQFIFYKGIVHAIKYKANIISITSGALWGQTNQCAKIIDDIFRIAANKNILVSAAAGNNKENIDSKYFMPSSSKADNLIVTGSSTCQGRRSRFSNFGRKNVDLFTIGEDVQVLYPHALATGTSFAAPLVTAVAALAAVEHSSFSYANTKKAIMESTTNKNLPSVTRGILNPSKVLCYGTIIGSGRPKIAPSPISSLDWQAESISQVNFHTYFSSTNTLSLSIASPRDAIAHISVISLGGSVLAQKELTLVKGKTSQEIEGLDNLSPGLYLVQAIIGNGEVITKKCFKNR